MRTKYIIFIVVTLTLTACRKFIEIDNPQDKLVRAKVFEEDATAISALGGMYASIMSDVSFQAPYTIALYCGLYGDEFVYKVNDLPRLSLYTYSLDAKDAITNPIWTRGYYYIYQANGIIEGLRSSLNVSSLVKKQLLGEALFLRAFWHFYLCNFYGDIPLVLSTDYRINGRLPRSPSQHVLDQIILDLNEAESLLTNKYVASNSISETTERIRPNAMAAKALLARIYLYRGEWNKAEEKANSIIASSTVYSLESIDNVFKKVSKEAIWQLEMPTGASAAPKRENTYEQRFILISRPSASNTGSDLSTSVLQNFQPNDLRRTKWIESFTDASGTYNFPFKYQSRVIDVVDEHSIVFRLAELFLIRAEAMTNQNKISDAINDLDQIRLRAGIPEIKNLNPQITKEALLDSISIERQRELFCEWGIRWFDIKRSKNSESTMRNIAIKKGVDWTSNWLVWPIPLDDIVNNNLLLQNDGYN